MLISNAKVNPAYRTYSKGNPFQVPVIFFRFNPVFLQKMLLWVMHVRDIFVEDENTSKASWAVHMSKICVRGLTVSQPSLGL